MKIKVYIKLTIACLIGCLVISCEDFLEIDPPIDKIVREDVFNNEATTSSALTGIYNQLFLSAFSNGSEFSITFLAGLSADNVKNISTTNFTRMEFEQNEISPNNANNLYIWSSAYNIIYLANSFHEGLEESETLSDQFKSPLKGEARFIRAFTYFYLVNLYGDIPLILSTNYTDNQLATRVPKEEIYDQIIADLQASIEVLPQGYEDGERTRANKFAAMSLLSRVHLYLENWAEAEELSSQVISQSTTYEILMDLDEIFLANSKEAIWQISPIGQGGIVTHTNDGSLFIINPFASYFARAKLNENLVSIFDEEDIRLLNWIGYNESRNAFFSSKYKIDNSVEFPIKEYSMVLRLAEQYLIRAEARAQLGNISNAIEDLKIIRNRAGIDLITEIDPGITKEELLDEIIEERRKELFTEWGHRWLDLKRTGRIQEVLGDNPFWEDTDVLYPIPAAERIKNPNLTQNSGY
jgi:hypothetical protein